jgi:hypothetical protein
MGRFSGSFSFAVPAAGPGAAAEAPAAANVTAALRSAEAGLVGEVVGPLAAQPQAIAFGVVTQGEKASRPVTLVAKQPAVLEGLKVTSGSPWLSCPLQPATGAAPASLTLEAVLNPGAPAGVLQTELTFTLANGRRLVLPVNAYVQPPPAPRSGNHR